MTENGNELFVNFVESIMTGLRSVDIMVQLNAKRRLYEKSLNDPDIAKKFGGVQSAIQKHIDDYKNQLVEEKTGSTTTAIPQDRAERIAARLAQKENETQNLRDLIDAAAKKTPTYIERNGYTNEPTFPTDEEGNPLES
ncbi:hypothetical protein KC678_00085 [Candidatus Dojkabacteria bacterium]|uniref:Uncharacterized protein n=1 Tax=Candidatus Dojkabacteria bacterium TaxID=2099670 RepID=A0A955IC26_9BACT|nr:hypothetical protein [Candidatus Dojkabacteria bacterium]